MGVTMSGKCAKDSSPFGINQCGSTIRSRFIVKIKGRLENESFRSPLPLVAVLLLTLLYIIFKNIKL